MWADITAWLQSSDGARLLQAAVVPGLAILVAGVLAALIGRAAATAAIRRADREQAVTIVSALVEAARAATDPDRPGRRRADRLRTDADVRLRLLPVRGADRAADWAAAQTDALVTAGSTDLTTLRDALIAWLRTPRRAPRLFATVPGAPVSLPTLGVDRASSGPIVADEAIVPGAADDDGASASGIPAWRRTRAGERLEQARAERVYGLLERESTPDETAPVRLRRTSPFAPPTEDAAEPEPAPPSRHPAPPDGAAPEPVPSREPSWIDAYDDEAEVTQNLDLRTPPPVSASTVRDRAPSNADIVPRG